MVIFGWVLDKPMALLFDPFESVVLFISGKVFCPDAWIHIQAHFLPVHTMGYVIADGKSNWLEGALLISKCYNAGNNISVLTSLQVST